MAKLSASFVMSRSQATILFWVFAWVFCHVLNLTAVKLVGADIPVVSMICLRSFFGLFFLIVPLLLNQRFKSTLRTKAPYLQAVRAILVLGAMGATYYGYRAFPIALGTSLGFTQPLLVSFFAVIFLKEKMTLLQWSLLLLGYTGALFFANPFAHAYPLGAWVLLGANILASIVVILTKKLFAYDTPSTIIFYTFSSVFVITAFGMGFAWESPSWQDLGLLVFMGAAGTLSQFAFITAINATSASFVAPFDYLKLVIAMPIGAVFFGESLTWHVAVGGALIVGSNWYLARQKPLSRSKSAFRG